MFLFVFDQGIGDLIEKTERPFVAQVQQSLTSNSVMYRKSNPDMWYT